MKQLHLIMPMGGKGSRFFEDGFAVPKPLIMLNGKPFLYWAIQSVVKFVAVKDVICVVLQEHIEEHQIDQVIRQYYPQAKIVVIPEVLDGPVLTCLKGLAEIKDDDPILFNDCDHLFTSEAFYEFCEQGYDDNIDGALLTFKANDPKYSFLEYDDKGNVMRTVEKEVVSDCAICGAYYVKNKEIFQFAADDYLKECSYREFFVSGIYNVLAKERKVIKGFRTDIHISFGTPTEYYEAEEDKRFGMVE